MTPTAFTRYCRTHVRHRTPNDENPKTLADIVREETGDGRIIVRFLIEVMQGQIDDSKPCHRLDAARQLLNLGFDGAQSVIQSVSQSASVRAPSTAPRNPADQGSQTSSSWKPPTAKIAVRFLVDVMQGNLQDFKPHHRLAAAKELLRRGFDNTPGHSDDEYADQDESFDDDDPRTPEQRDPNSPNYVDRYAHLYNKEDDPFDFENYDEEQYRRDGDGGRALRHIYGSKEVRIVAIDAVNHHHCDTGFDETYIPDRDFTPIENPEDDPYGKGSYGYNALRFAYGDNDCVRAANKAVAEFKKRKAEHPEGESENEGPPVDRPSTSFPQHNGNSSSDDDDTMPPDHWSRPYLDRLRNSSTETDKSSEDPDPPSSVPPERPQVGAGFKPDRGLARPSTGRESKSPENPDPGESEVPQIIRRQGPAQEKTRQNLRRPAGRKPAPMQGPRRLPKRDRQHLVSRHLRRPVTRTKCCQRRTPAARSRL